VIATIQLGTTGLFSRIAIGNRSVYVTVPFTVLGDQSNRSNIDIKEIDPATNKSTNVARLTTGDPRPDIAAGFDSIWVTTDATTSPSALYRFDQVDPSNHNATTLPDAAPVGLNAVTAGEGYVWAVSARGYLWKIDPTTRRHDDPTTVGAHPPTSAEDVVTGFGFAWVASGDGQIWQYAP
jgi:hypothetical protein